MAEKDEVNSKDVKSTAIVKYSLHTTLPKFLLLQPQTNLNTPPENWLRCDSIFESYLQNVSWGRRHAEFSSFNMANNSPDVVDELDVISDAENIKKLLKIPYCKGPCSMMVHRVGKTLLLDDFDIHKHLFRQEQDDWKWLRQFYYETVMRNMQDKDKACVEKKNKSRNFLQNRNMFSKFLYHSVEGKKPSNESANFFCPPTASADNQSTSLLLPDPLPEPRPAEYGRTVLWTFEDIRMLIGTDMPIFGGGTHPCVSLRLRDADKPINVLTGIDYWLDNLMCNVPELAMCYHLDGIVQRYEVIRTEEIPTFQNSEFSPLVIKDVAQNILSFLKSNATKEGHTYWLFKETDSDIVKLYDLTTLCAEFMQNDRTQNPFTVPVGMLLYRVARNMTLKNEGREKAGIIQTLLTNCLLLLDKDQHSQIVTSAYYLLANLYAGDNMNSLENSPPKRENEKRKNAKSFPAKKSAREQQTSSSVEIKDLSLPNSCRHSDVEQSPTMPSGIEERCNTALRYIAEGLSCLDSDVSGLIAKQQQQTDEPITVRNPTEAIPLRYEPLKKTNTQTCKSHDLESVNQKPRSQPHGAECTNQIQGFESHSSDATNQEESLTLVKIRRLGRGSWHCTSKTLLLTKALGAYYELASVRHSSQKLGESLKYLKLALNAYAAMKMLTDTDSAETLKLLSAVLELAGDVRLTINHSSKVKDLSTHEEGYESLSDVDKEIIASTGKDVGYYEFNWACEFTTDAEDNLRASLKCYKTALQMDQQTTEEDKLRIESLMKRFGNVNNELGVHYMNQAIMLSHSNDKTFDQQEGLWRQSLSCFETGIQTFEQTSDKVNMVLLLSNLGKLMRAQSNALSLVITLESGKREFTLKEKQLLSKAADYYQEGLRVLKHRDKYHDVWDSLTWELSSTYFTIATMLQDYAPLSTRAQEEVEREVTDNMTKALKYCEIEVGMSRSPMCQYRAATIHHRLASLYHNVFRNQASEQKRKRNLAELHYVKAYALFDALETTCELLRVQLERVAMCEFQLQQQTSNATKLKTLQTALEYILETTTALQSIQKQLKGASADEATEDLEEKSFESEAEKLLNILDSRLQFVLMSAVKVTASYKKGKHGDIDTKMLEISKKCYATYLHNIPQHWELSPLLEKYQSTIDILNKLYPLHFRKGEG